MHSLLVFAMLVSPPIMIQPGGSSAEPRRPREIQLDMREVFRHLSEAASDADRLAAVTRISALYGEVVTHPRYERSQLLEKYRIRMWSRLRTVKEDVQKRLRRSEPVRRTTTQGTGSPAGAGGGGAVVTDYGPRLVDLIESTIAPETWDVNGGPGTIYYYRPLRVLVVRATDDVHHRVGGVIGALRE